ncbi:uncharacterized protein [Narcine bancroftii]|uniref:uncharacterized protein n=1 Tax=Narcine bancroftii TaxID=1343680 RepID=UPI003831EFEF
MATTAGHVDSLLQVTDKSTSRHFLMYTGPELSILPTTALEKCTQSHGPTLQTANGSANKTFSTRRAQIQIGKEKFCWKFVLASMGTALLGANFLRAHGLLVNVKGKRLVNAHTLHSVCLGTMNTYRPMITTIATSRDAYLNILHEYPAILQPQFSATLPQHGVCHHISMQCPPLHTKPRQLLPEKLQLAKEEFSWLQESLGQCLGISSPHGPQIHRGLETLQQLLPFEQCDHTGQVPGSTHSRLLSQSSRRVSSPRSIWCGGIIRSKSTLRTSARRRSSPPLAFLNSCVCLSASRMRPSHFSASWMQWVGTLCLSTWTISLLPAATTKCTRPISIPCLPNWQSLASWSTWPSASSASRCCSSWDTPSQQQVLPQRQRRLRPSSTSPSQLLWPEEFVGMVNFYDWFIPSPTRTMQPLFALIATKEKVLTWLEEAETAFATTKEALANATLLVHPRPEAHMALSVDASATAVGGVLEQWLNRQWRPLTFFSKQLHPAKLKYSAFDREFLVLYLSIRHFRYFLEDRPFMVFMDHKPLTQALAMAKDP